MEITPAPALSQARGVTASMASKRTPVNRDEAGAQGALISASLTDRSMRAPTLSVTAASGPDPSAISASATLRRSGVRAGRDRDSSDREGPQAGAFFPSDGGNQISMEPPYRAASTRRARIGADLSAGRPRAETLEERPGSTGQGDG